MGILIFRPLKGVFINHEFTLAGFACALTSLTTSEGGKVSQRQSKPIMKLGKGSAFELLVQVLGSSASKNDMVEANPKP